MQNFNGLYFWNKFKQSCNRATAVLVYLCLFVWLIEFVLHIIAPDSYASLLEHTIFIPALALKTPWTWFTSMFLHAPTFSHIILNMLCLWSLGNELERYFGRWKFVTFYIISGFAGAVATFIWCAFSHQWAMSAYGASGAIMGLIGALIVAQWRLGQDMRGTLIWIAITLGLPFIIPNIAWQAHVGGLIVGIILAAVLGTRVPWLEKASYNTRFLVHATSVVVILCACVVFCISWIV